MSTTPHAVPRLPAPILELCLNQQVKDLNALGRIFAALRCEAAPPSLLGELISTAAEPTPEVVPAPSVKCKHGLREAAWCATCKELSNLDQLAPRKESRGCVVGPWMTFMYPPACRPRAEQRFSTMVFDQRGTKNCAGCAHDGEGFKKKIITRTVSAIEDRSGYVWQNRMKPVVLTLKPGWGWVAPKFADALSLAEHAARHKNDQGATLPHLPNHCDGCLMHVTILHDADRCAAKALAEQQAAAERNEMIRKRSEQRRHAALIVQGYSAEAFDQEIIRSRRGTVEADIITKFDRNLTRKGNKWRIK